MGVPRDARAPLPRSAAGARQLSRARLNGTEIAYDAAGAAEDPAVVLLHAGVGDRRLWDDQVEALAESHLVVRLDLRGHGESPLPGGPFSYVDDLRALLDYLGIAETSLIANSFGGRVAIDFALAHPERVRALLLAAPALTGWEMALAMHAFDEEEDALLDAGKIDEAVELNVRTWLDGQNRGPAPVPQELRERLAAMQRRAFETILAAYEAPRPPGPVAWSEPPARARLGEITAPTLVVTGRHDLEDFRAIGELLAREIPRAESITIDTAHLPALEAPDEFNRIARDFLRVYAGPDQGG